MKNFLTKHKRLIAEMLVFVGYTVIFHIIGNISGIQSIAVVGFALILSNQLVNRNNCNN